MMIGVVHMATGGDGAIHVDQFLRDFTYVWEAGDELPAIIMGDFNMDMAKYLISSKAEIISSNKNTIKGTLKTMQERIVAHKAQSEKIVKPEKFQQKLQTIERLEAQIQQKQTELDTEESEEKRKQDRKTLLSRWAAAFPEGTNTTIFTYRPSCLDNHLFLSECWELEKEKRKVHQQSPTALLSDHQPIGITLKPKSNDG
jgi:endonuclease/exonuclease/phosphatase family metal-dependent hydrolase